MVDTCIKIYADWREKNGVAKGVELFSAAWDKLNDFLKKDPPMIIDSYIMWTLYYEALPGLGLKLGRPSNS